MGIDLIEPLGSGFMKDWPSQNAVNCDRIDEYAGPQSPRTADLGTYTPVLSATTTAPNLGDGTIGGFYYKIFDQIWSWGWFRFGTGFSVGSGVYTITLPFKVKSLIPPSTALAGAHIIGNGYVWDNTGTARQPVSAALRTNQTIMFGLRMNSGAGAREMTNLAPITWAALDGFKWAVRYQRDPT